MADIGDLPVEGDVIETARRVLDRHSVSFALLFGSGARPSTTEADDLDIAVEFEKIRPEDGGYSDDYLRLLSDLDDALPVDVDVVDVHTMSPEFARVAFDDGVRLVGSDDRRRELERAIAGDEPSVADARERVAAAANRLREES